MSVLVLGASGLLGNAMFRVLAETVQVFGTVRNAAAREFFVPELGERLLQVHDLEDAKELAELLDATQPRAVINCIALARDFWNDPLKMISVFGLFPKRLAHLCEKRGIRLIHVSSDGVFRGTRGRYTEEDLPDATDPYGVSKILGEVSSPLAITLRTSIIGHELQSKSGLLEWFLSEKEKCRCYANAIFSGLPSVVFAQVVRDIVLPRPNLCGVYHVAARGISKCDLLQLIAARYGCSTRIIPDQTVRIDRTLRADRFASATGYEAPEWPVLIDAMYSYKFGLKVDG